MGTRGRLGNAGIFEKEDGIVTKISNFQLTIFNKFPMSQLPNEKPYNLEERTAKFSENVVVLLSGIKKNPINLPIISQLVRAATSIGANYCEANDASSRKDFRNKIYVCKEEANETKYWLRILAQAEPAIKDKIRILWQEAQELNLIFQKIVNSLNAKKLV